MIAAVAKPDTALLPRGFERGALEWLVFLGIVLVVCLVALVAMGTWVLYQRHKDELEL